MIDKLGIPCARWHSSRKVWLDPEERAISPSGPEHIARCPLRIGIVSTGLMVQPSREKEFLTSITFDVDVEPSDDTVPFVNLTGVQTDVGEGDALHSCPN